jgi:hypothetical protein
MKTLGRKQFLPSAPLPLGIKVLVAFFAFGTLACAVTVAALLFPATPLHLAWQVNPEAEEGFRQVGRALSLLLMTTVGLACASAAYGLARTREWGRRLAIAILTVNLVGDCANAWVRHDPRTLIGLPVGGAMILYLVRSRGSKPQPESLSGM